ncbi:MAG: T9SS type A sorting domain-containing protein, partial [Melioribacteraceae bacterium]|nr:T9SS type A sorting domain-containing protein [Melioribacteraceae bacterium]
PKSLELTQNYPNPFNPSTVIEFSVPQNTHVKLAVYDILGREVSILVDKDMSAGNYKVDFDASHLTSGIYMYKISANNSTKSMKMILQK